jgi:hypothetical protein
VTAWARNCQKPLQSGGALPVGIGVSVVEVMTREVTASSWYMSCGSHRLLFHLCSPLDRGLIGSYRDGQTRWLGILHTTVARGPVYRRRRHCTGGNRLRLHDGTHYMGTRVPIAIRGGSVQSRQQWKTLSHTLFVPDAYVLRTVLNVRENEKECERGVVRRSVSVA